MGKKIIRNKYLRLMLSSFIAGFIIAISGFALIAMKAVNLLFVGAFLQGACCLIIALISLKAHNSYLLDVFREKKKSAYLNLIIIFIINIASIVLFSYIFRLIFNNIVELTEAAEDLAEVREVVVGNYDGKDCILSCGNGIMCGALVAAGSMTFKECPSKFKWFGAIAIVASVTIFVVSGFENFNTNISYITYALSINLSNFVGSFLVLVGNVLGAYLIHRVTMRIKNL